MTIDKIKPIENAPKPTCPNTTTISMCPSWRHKLHWLTKARGVFLMLIESTE